jgi:hypothetical protein
VIVPLPGGCNPRLTELSVFDRRPGDSGVVMGAALFCGLTRETRGDTEEMLSGSSTVSSSSAAREFTFRNFTFAGETGRGNAGTGGGGSSSEPSDRADERSKSSSETSYCTTT